MGIDAHSVQAWFLYYPQAQGVVDQMNAIVVRRLRFSIHYSIEIWEVVLKTGKTPANSLLRSRTRNSPFYINEKIIKLQVLTC